MWIRISHENVDYKPVTYISAQAQAQVIHR